MKYLDKKFQKNKRRYIAQSILAGCTVAAALLCFDIARQPVIIASLGASTFIAFTIPHIKFSGPKHLIGGYIIGIAVGCLMHFLTDIPIDDYLMHKIGIIVAGSAAVAVAMFLMTITDTEHAPAASIALGFVINEWTFKTVILILIGVIIISIIQRILKRWMIDLIS